jgi:glycosyltransferase involved in cell wall biosynthesis
VLLAARVIVVVPASDERPRVGRVIASIPGFVDHVVVVDDASRDGTADAARASADPRVEVIVHETNRGVGAAIATGYRRALELTAAPNDAIAVMAGDAQMDSRDLARVVEPIARGRAGYVKGNRFAWPGVRRIMPLGRWAAGHVLSSLTSRAVGTRIDDSQCGFSAVARGACRRLDLRALWPGYGYPNDLLGQLGRLGVVIAQVPVRPIYADEVSRLRPRHAFTALWLIARAWARGRGRV